MPLAHSILGGQLRHVHREAENAVHRANPMLINQDPHAAADRAQQAEQATVGQVGDAVETVVTYVRETIPEVVFETRSISAFIAELVPIPWLDGDQKPHA